MPSPKRESINPPVIQSTAIALRELRKRMNRRRAIVTTLAAFATTLAMIGAAAQALAQTPTPAPGQPKPNFAGTWKLNLDKSDLPDMMRPTGETDTVTQTGDAVKVSIAADSPIGKLAYSFSAKLDGTDTPAAADDFPANSPFKILSSKAVWQGASLIITQKSNFQDVVGTLTLTFTLSDDGKVLTKATHISFDAGEFDSKSVYDKA